jgi:glycosyltransferase A (GT-A) superfamily protein (DUF2064 family)
MSSFFRLCFKNGHEAAVIIGSDAPSLTTAMVDEAFVLLKQNDVVFGPSTDGGYYLVGLSRMAREIFEGIEWSTEKVLQQSIAKCESLGLTVATIRPLTDIDDEADLQQELESLRSSDDSEHKELAKAIERILSESAI